jgi:hypothetical protein
VQEFHIKPLDGRRELVRVLALSGFMPDTAWTRLTGGASMGFLDKLLGRTKDVAGDVAAKTGDIAEKTVDVAGDAASKGADVAGDVYDKSKDVVGDAVDKGRDVVDGDKADRPEGSTPA